MIVYDNGEIVARVLGDLVCISTVKVRQQVYVTLEELTDIAEAVAQHLESAAEPFFTEEEVS